MVYKHEVISRIMFLKKKSFYHQKLEKNKANKPFRLIFRILSTSSSLTSTTLAMALYSPQLTRKSTAPTSSSAFSVPFQSVRSAGIILMNGNVFLRAASSASCPPSAMTFAPCLHSSTTIFFPRSVSGPDTTALLFRKFGLSSCFTVQQSTRFISDLFFYQFLNKRRFLFLIFPKYLNVYVGDWNDQNMYKPRS